MAAGGACEARISRRVCKSNEGGSVMGRMWFFRSCGPTIGCLGCIVETETACGGHAVGATCISSHTILKGRSLSCKILTK